MGPQEEAERMFDFYSSYPCPAVIMPFRKTPLTSRGAGDPSLSAGIGAILQLPHAASPIVSCRGTSRGGRGHAGVGHGQRPSAVIKLLRH